MFQDVMWTAASRQHSDLRRAQDVTKEDVKALMLLVICDPVILQSVLLVLRYPDDMEDDSMLVPVDVSDEPDDFPTSYEELNAKAPVWQRLWSMLNTITLPGNHRLSPEQQ